MRCVFDADAQYKMLASPRILTNVSLANRFSFTANLRLSKLFLSTSQTRIFTKLFSKLCKLVNWGCQMTKSTTKQIVCYISKLQKLDFLIFHYRVSKYYLGPLYLIVSYSLMS